MSRSIWRRHLRGWLPPLIVFLVALGLMSFYRLFYAGEALAGGRLLERREAEVAELSERRQQVQELAERVRTNEEQIARFRNERLATEQLRLTQVIAEVKKQARRAGVEPSSIRYPEQRLKGVGLTKRSIVFSVDGDYPALRRFINFLELSDLFLTLEEVSLSGSAGGSGRLRISLEVSTLFLDEPAPPASAAAGATS